MACRLFFTCCSFFTMMNALSVVALSVQRFCVTVRSLRTGLCVPHLLTVWLFSFASSLPIFVMKGSYGFMCSCDNYPTKLLFGICDVLFGTALPSLVFFLSVLTARRLPRDMPGEHGHAVQEKVRCRSERVVTALAVVFILTYTPFYLWCLAASLLDKYRQRASFLVSEYLVKYLLFSNGCFKPIALYVASGTFRRLFRGYFYCSAKTKKNVSCADILSPTNTCARQVLESRGL
jgi:hypothetical protein